MANLAPSDSARIAIYKQERQQREDRLADLDKQQQEKKGGDGDDKEEEEEKEEETSPFDDNSITAAAAETIASVDYDLFRRHHIDVDALLGITPSPGSTKEPITPPPAQDIKAVLLQNVGLLLELQSLQEERFAQENKDPKRISELEQQLGK
jgi:hypothetical protein